MNKLICLPLMLAALSAHAFEIRPGIWQYPHTASWSDRDSGRPDSVQGSDTLCVSRKAARNYAQSQADDLDTQQCRVQAFQNEGDRASFQVLCLQQIRFEMRYEKQSDQAVRMTQTIHNPKGRDYIVDGVMQFERDDPTDCAEGETAGDGK